MPDVVEALDLARELVRIESAGGNEETVAMTLAPLLEKAGFEVRAYELSAGRTSIVATTGDPVVTLSGHLDTVPFQRESWSVPPTAGVVKEGRLWGRGAADMKGGVASLVVAALTHVSQRHECAGVRVVLTAGEESGCLGAGTVPVGRGTLLLVGEPTGNVPCVGHKGATWFEVSAQGLAAHGSRPDLGRNAVVSLARLAVKLVDGFPHFEHPQLGSATVNVGSFHGGSQANIVPDGASMTVDVRTVPGFDARCIEDMAERSAGPEYRVRRLVDLAPVWSSPDTGALAGVLDVLRRARGRRYAGYGVTSYFTDASVLAKRGEYEAVLIMGPGEPEQAHVVDESCPVSEIEVATSTYLSLLDEGCSTGFT